MAVGIPVGHGLSDCLDGKLVYNHWMKKNLFWTESLLSSLSLSYLLPPLLLFSLLLPCFPLSTFHALSLSFHPVILGARDYPLVCLNRFLPLSAGWGWGMLIPMWGVVRRGSKGEGCRHTMGKGRGL